MLIVPLVFWTAGRAEAHAIARAVTYESEASSNARSVLIEDRAPEIAPKFQCAGSMGTSDDCLAKMGGPLERGFMAFLFAAQVVAEIVELPGRERPHITTDFIAPLGPQGATVRRVSGGDFKPAFDNRGGAPASVNESERDAITSPQMSVFHLMHDPESFPDGEVGTMRGIEFVSGQIPVTADQAQLPNKQTGLQGSDTQYAQSEELKPVRIIRDPLRFESEFLVDYRFIYSAALVLLGFAFGGSSGVFFSRERFLTGTAMIGGGWICIVGAYLL